MGDTSRRGEVLAVYKREGGENQLLRISERTTDCLAFTATSHKDPQRPAHLHTKMAPLDHRKNPHRQQHAFKSRSNLWQTGGWLHLSKNPFQRVTKMTPWAPFFVSLPKMFSFLFLFYCCVYQGWWKLKSGFLFHFLHTWISGHPPDFLSTCFRPDT